MNIDLSQLGYFLCSYKLINFVRSLRPKANLENIFLVLTNRTLKLLCYDQNCVITSYVEHFGVFNTLQQS